MCTTELPLGRFPPICRMGIIFIFFQKSTELPLGWLQSKANANGIWGISGTHKRTSSYPGWIKSPHVVTLGILKFSGGVFRSKLWSSQIWSFPKWGGYSGVNFGHPKSEVFQNGGGYSGVNFGHPRSEVFWNGGGGLSGLRFQKGAFWKIWTKIYCAARNLLVHHSSLSHTTYVETNEVQWKWLRALCR